MSKPHLQSRLLDDSTFAPSLYRYADGTYPAVGVKVEHGPVAIPEWLMLNRALHTKDEGMLWRFWWRARATGNEAVIEALASNVSIVEGIAWGIIRHGSRKAREALAFNCGGPEEVLLDLMRDKSAGVRGALIWNPMTTRGMLEHLLNDADPKNRRMSLEAMRARGWAKGPGRG